MDMDTIDEPHLPCAARHHQGLRANAVTEEANALQQRSVCDPASCKDDILPWSEVFRAVDLLHIFDSHFGDAFFEFGTIDHQSRKNFPVEAAHGSGSDHALRSSTDSHNGMNTGAEYSGGNAG